MAAPPPSCHLHHVLRSQPTSSPSISLYSPYFGSLLKPLLLSSTITTPNAISKRLRQIQIPHLRNSITHFSTPLFCHFFSYSSLAVPQRHSPALGVGDTTETAEDDDGAIEQYDEEVKLANDELEISSDEVTQMGLDLTSSPLERNREERLKLPNLTVKERKELASYAHSLGKKLKSQLVGKSGVTSNVASSFIENLESNELLKIKIHRTCPGELDDVVKQLEEATGSVAVGQIGRTVIIYRPSLTKLKIEEKKKQVREVFMRKQAKQKLSKEPVSKLSRQRSRSPWKQ